MKVLAQNIESYRASLMNGDLYSRGILHSNKSLSLRNKNYIIGNYSVFYSIRKLKCCSALVLFWEIGIGKLDWRQKAPGT